VNEALIGLAAYPAGAWLSVREDGALVPDPVKRALGITRRALFDILDAADNPDEPFGRPEIRKIAADALEAAGIEEADL
jgi:hypothetical protein